MLQTPHTKAPSSWYEVPSVANAGPSDAANATPPPTTLPDPRSLIESYKKNLQHQLIKTIDIGRMEGLPASRQRTELNAILTQAVAANPPPVSQGDYDRIVREMLDEMLGYGPLEPLLADPTVSDILVNGIREVYVERGGCLELTDVRFRDDEHIYQLLQRIVSRIGRRVDEASPMVDARLPDGSRVNGIIPPLSLRGPVISIRRFGGKSRTLDDLTQLGMMTPEMAALLQGAVRARLNIVVSGGTGSGKTTLLNALSRFIPDNERIVTIEDAAELQLQQRHVLPLESRPPNIEGKGAVAVRDLVRNALRMRPDRIVVGECRGAEALDMLQAMNTGHDGSLTTIHANAPRDVFSRLETMVLMAGYDLPIKAIRQQIAGAVDLIVQTARMPGGVRKVTAITEVLGLEQDTIQHQDIFVYEQTGVSAHGRARGLFKSTGVRPHFVERFAMAGFPLPPEMFVREILHRDE